MGDQIDSRPYFGQLNPINFTQNDDITLPETTRNVVLVGNIEQPADGRDVTRSDEVDAGGIERPLHYKMTHPRRGAAVIFNHFKFNDRDLEDRDGTEKDKEKLENVLRQLQFDVVVHNDKTLSEIFEIIDSLLADDHSNADCLLIAVLSHGDAQGMIHARDHEYPLDKLFKSFTGDKCPTLVGKPKLFFVQACRGNKTDPGAFVPQCTQIDNKRVRLSHKAYKIPVMADLLVMYSTYDGFYSFRHSENGSWFIQCLCNELKKHAKNYDLLSILTFVNNTMAVHYESHTPERPRLHKKKQIGTVVSTLTRLLHFYPRD